MQFEDIPPIENAPPPVEEIKPHPNIWGAWPTVGFSAAVFGIFFAAQTLVTVIFMAVLLAQNPSLNSITEITDFIMGLQSNGLLLSTAIIVSGICGFFFVWLFIKIRHGYSFEDYLELRTPGWRTWVSLIGVMAGLMIFSILMDKVHTDTSSLKTMTDAYLTSGWTPIFWIATVVFAPIFEETLFRGFLFVGLRNSRVGPMWTVIITAFTFAILHSTQYDYYGLIAILVLGLVFGLVRLISKSLWSTIVLHAAWNLMTMISLAYYIKGLT
jgi:membrane protease YdiL (CAAX protease family)